MGNKNIMENKLTREDFEGYRSQIALSVKVAMMKQLEGEMALDWLNRVIKRMPKPKNAKK